MKMNTRKLLFFAGLSFLAATKMFAGSNEKGIDYFNAELYEAAKIFFLQQTDLSLTDQAENYYYLGQTYYELDQVDSAAYYYQKAISSFPEYPFGYIGEGKLELKKGNKKVAEELFKKANNFAKKNPAIQTTIAEVYLDAGDYNNVIIALDKARKINSKYSGIYIVEGDMLFKQGKIGEACSRYDNAILFNSADKVAYLKSAKIYREININRALEYLEQLVALDPNYIPAYAVFGDIYREERRYKDALDAYEKFIAIPGVPLLQHERYAQLLFFTNQFDKALDHIKYVISKDPDNLAMKRIEAYNSLRLEKYSLGLEQMNHLLKIMGKERHIYQDYTTLAQLAAKEKQPRMAIDAYRKAIELDPKRAILDRVYKEMPSVATASGMYPEAVTLYEEYLAVEEAPDALDYYSYGQACYAAASYYTNTDNIASVKTPEEIAAYEASLKEYVQKGDKAFAELAVKRPNLHLGFIWRANINALLDNYDAAKGKKMEGYAKPYFEEALGVMLENNTDGARNKEIVNAYKYLASYYYTVNDMPNLIDVSKKILSFDPTDEVAKQTLKVLKVKY